MQNKGTLIGAPIRINDDQDTYPSAFQSEIKGGHHNRALFADLATFPLHLKEFGMTCYVAENGNTYRLSNDLSTWVLHISATGTGGTTNPGSGGNTSTATIISGNFGEWQNIPGKSALIFDEQVLIQYKTDLSAFPTRSITYLTGQFGLDSTFVGTDITLGGLPVGNRPKTKIKKWMCCRGVEMYLVIETTGAIKLTSKDGFNLPVTTTGTENDPYFIEVFFNPDIATVSPTTYSYTRTENFTKNDCGISATGSVVPFSKTYTSTISVADAQAIAMADPTYNSSGQNNANTNGTCTVLQSVNLTVNSFWVDYPENEFNVNAVLDTALSQLSYIYVKVHYTDSLGVNYSTMTGVIQIPAGQIYGYALIKPSVNTTGNIVTSVEVTTVNPNPNGGKLINY